MHLILHDNDVICLLEKFGLTRHKNSSFLSQKSVVANHLQISIGKRRFCKNCYLQSRKQWFVLIGTTIYFWLTNWSKLVSASNTVDKYSQLMLNYCRRWIITVQLTSGLWPSGFVCVKISKKIFVRFNSNQSAVQWYFTLQSTWVFSDRANKGFIPKGR